MPRKSVKSPNPVGRPTKYVPETIQAIIASLAIGNTKEDSAVAAGVTYTTMRQWELDYPEFSEATQKAQAQARQRMVGTIAKAAADGNWVAAMTYLERRDPEHWARRDRMDIQIDVRKEAERIAAANDLNVEDVLAEANRIVASHT